MTAEESTFWETAFWEALMGRDSRMDGFFFYAVVSTGVYCRPSCPSRRPRRVNVVFFREREAAERAGFRPCLRCKPDTPIGAHPHAELVKRVCRYIETNLDAPLTLGAVGRRLGVSPFHLQRTFKSLTGITPRAYADACRLEVMKAGLRRGDSVTRAMVDAGYSSSSRLYERTASQLGMAPRQYRNRAAGVVIRYAVVDTALGKLLVAGTEKGVCAIRLGDTRAALEKALREEFAQARLEHAPQSIEPWTERLRDHLAGNPAQPDLPLDIQATAFQRLVWEHLRTIPRGQTESYSEVARRVGRPTAARAVARACASNPVALAIPCHRVVREDGELGGYRWGIGRKRRLLEMESQSQR
jgi:AraC family transcriptional regulator, regulatory protein of adaptative response / methylated-DNA-[protein]-cysteine methyltransferase